jgi:hypothetical protein
MHVLVVLALEAVVCADLVRVLTVRTLYTLHPFAVYIVGIHTFSGDRFGVNSSVFALRTLGLLYPQHARRLVAFETVAQPWQERHWDCDAFWAHSACRAGLRVLSALRAVKAFRAHGGATNCCKTW